MARKWGDIWDLRKIWELSIIALIAAMPSLALAEAVLTSQAYVDSQDALKVDIAQGSGNAGKVLVVGNDGSVTLSSSTISSDLSGKEDVSNKLNGTSTSGQKIGDLTAGSAAGQDQVMYPSAAAVKEYAVAKHPGVGTNNANVGKALIVDSSGDLALGDVDALPAGSANQVIQYNGTNNTWDAVTMDTTPTDSSNKPVTSGGVYDAVNGNPGAFCRVAGRLAVKLRRMSGIQRSGSDVPNIIIHERIRISVVDHGAASRCDREMLMAITDRRRFLRNAIAIHGVRTVPMNDHEFIEIIGQS